MNKPNYSEISCIVFDHKLDNNEILAIQEILFTKNNNVSQLYFKDSIDINSIEIVKYLLEISPEVNDRQIEKYILLTDIDYETILNMNFENIDSWKISYNSFDNRYKLVSVSEYRKIKQELNNYISKIKEDFTVLEKIGIIYNFCKSLDFNEDVSDLPDVLENKNASSLGMNLLFKSLLDSINIRSFIGEVTNDGKDNYVTIVDIKDEKYNADGIYLFDILSDSIPKDMYSNNELRLINYNYFALNIDEYQETVFEDKLKGVLSSLSHDLNYDLEKVKLLSNNQKERLSYDFDMNFDSVHERVKNTVKIKDEDKIKLIEVINNKSLTNGIDLDIIKDNYFSRNESIFRKNKMKIMEE